MSGLTVEKIRAAKRILEEQPDFEYDDSLCDKVLWVLGEEGDDVFRPCKLKANHPGRCEPDYSA